jgi:IS1 family transposase
MILAGRVGKHTDELVEELVWSTEGKTDCLVWSTDGWRAYERVLPAQVEQWVGKIGTQRLERTLGIVRQQTRRWHRRQNKFGKVWEQTEMTVRLVISYFNWIWQNTWTRTTAAQRAGLATEPWHWDDFATYPTLLLVTTLSIMPSFSCGVPTCAIQKMTWFWSWQSKQDVRVKSHITLVTLLV